MKGLLMDAIFKIIPSKWFINLSIGVVSIFMLLAPAKAEAIDTLIWISPGLKLSYTFGEGFTYGFELSITSAPESWDDMKEQPYATSIVFNIDTTFKGVTKMRLGAQIVGPFIGIEAGPTVIFFHGKTYWGYSITPWAGLYWYPHYTYTKIFGKNSGLHELGVYLKGAFETSGRFRDTDDHEWDD
jgi:hypothetical protein